MPQPNSEKPMLKLGAAVGDPLLLAACLSLAAYLAFSQAIFNDGDTSWHLAAGKLILAELRVPHVDPFSFTFLGRAWTAHEWLAEVLLAGALNAGSWAAVALLTAGAVAALLLVLGLELRRLLPPRRVLMVLAAIFIILAPAILARPHVLAWPLLAGWTIILLRAREADRAPALGWALLMLAWANLHGSFVLGLAVAGAFGLEALIASDDRRRAMLSWGLFGAASLAAALLTPHGVEGLLFPLAVSGMETLPLIAEWRPTSFAEDKAFLALAAVTTLLLLYRRPRLSLVRWGLLAGLLYLAIAHARHQPILAIIAPLLLARPLAGPMPGSPTGSARQLLAAALAGFVMLGAVRLALPLERGDMETYPISAIRAVPGDLRDRPLLNSYSFGGPLILHGIKPFIDGRADLYGDAFMRGHKRIMDGDGAAFDAAARTWALGWTLLAPEEKLVALLDRHPGWRRTYADRWAVIHVPRD